MQPASKFDNVDEHDYTTARYGEWRSVVSTAVLSSLKGGGPKSCPCYYIYGVKMAPFSVTDDIRASL
jgi:hypothetical protein